MSLTLRTNFGCNEAVIADDGSLHLFYQIAAMINEDLRVKFTNKEDEFDAISWQFRYKGNDLTLYYSIYNGISVFPTRTNQAQQKENQAVIDLSTIIETMLLEKMPSRHIA